MKPSTGKVLAMASKPDYNPNDYQNADKDDYKKVREEDKISIVGLKEFAPGKPLTAILYHADGTEESFAVNHTYNELQIKWFKAGAALNAAR